MDKRIYVYFKNREDGVAEVLVRCAAIKVSETMLSWKTAKGWHHCSTEHIKSFDVWEHGNGILLA